VNTSNATPDPRQRRRALRAPSPAMAVALVALFVALGGTGYAVTRLPSNSVGTSQLRKSAVTSSKIRPHTIRLSDISTSTRSSLRGQKGSQGPTGPQGPPGPDASIFHAAIDSGGGTPRGNAVGASHTEPGVYTIAFSRDVSGCEATATLASVPGGSTTNPPAGRITVRPNGTRIEVHTFDFDGSVRDLPFNVIVAC
jgi:hypothetical protein